MALNEIREKNINVENQLYDGTSQQILSEPLNKLIDDGELSIIDAKLTYNSPLADLRNEQTAFNEQIKQIKYELDHKINVITEKQVEKSIREIQEKIENQMKDKLLKQQYIENSNKKQDKVQIKLDYEEKINNNSSKLQELVQILQKHLVDKFKSKKSLSNSDSHISNQYLKSPQHLPQLSQNRKHIVSKWDQQAKNNGIKQVFSNKNLNYSNSNQISMSLKQKIDRNNGNANKPNFSRMSRNFVEKNIINNTELNKNVYQQYGSLFDKNIPILEQRSGFNRSEIIHIFSKFKALCEMTMKELKDQGKDLSECKGVSFDKFKVCLPELKFETEKFAKRVFDQCNAGTHSQYLDWEHFLLAVKAIQARNVDQKIDLFFKIIDQDGNGMLSYEEVFEICSNSFEKFSPNIEEDYHMRGLTEFFTTVIFRAVGKSLDEEIPLQEIKQAIVKNLPDSDMLCLFCNADQNQSLKQQ